MGALCELARATACGTRIEGSRVTGLKQSLDAGAELGGTTLAQSRTAAWRTEVRARPAVRLPALKYGAFHRVPAGARVRGGQAR